MKKYRTVKRRNRLLLTEIEANKVVDNTSWPEETLSTCQVDDKIVGITQSPAPLRPRKTTVAVQCEECTCSPDAEGDSSLSSSSSSSSSCSTCSTSDHHHSSKKTSSSFLLSRKWINDKQNTIQEEDEEYDQEDTDTDQIIVNVPKLIVKGMRTTWKNKTKNEEYLPTFFV